MCWVRYDGRSGPRKAGDGRGGERGGGERGEREIIDVNVYVFLLAVYVYGIFIPLRTYVLHVVYVYVGVKTERE